MFTYRRNTFLSTNCTFKVQITNFWVHAKSLHVEIKKKSMSTDLKVKQTQKWFTSISKKNIEKIYRFENLIENTTLWVTNLWLQ